MSVFKKAMNEKRAEIETALARLHANLDDDEAYRENWFAVNDAFKWWLIRLEQWLGGFSTPYSEEIYQLCIDAQRLGQKNGYYWNKISKALILVVDEWEMAK